jgi:mRNA interferase RelE/StbE
MPSPHLPCQQSFAGARYNACPADSRPPGHQRLAGFDDLYRVRVGDYRIIYRIQDNVLMVVIVRLGHRRDIYRHMG